MADWTLSTLADAVRGRRVSPTEVTRDCLDKVKRSKLRAFVAVDEDGALEAARKCEI